MSCRGRERLADGRPRCENGHLSRMETVRELVQLDESGWHAGHLVAAPGCDLDLLERLSDALGSLAGAATRPPSFASGEVPLRAWDTATTSVTGVTAFPA